MPDWRIYYDDGSSFSSDEGEPHEAPAEGFICAVGYEPEFGKRYLMSRWDFYCFKEGQWWGMNWAGLLDMLRRNDVYAFKEGRTVTNPKWVEITRAAGEDPEFVARRRDP